MSDRRQESYAVRLEAAELARSREYPTHKANGDEQRYADAKYFMSFTKGLPHNEDTGLLEDPKDFVEFRRCIDDGFIDPFTDRVRHGAKFKVTGPNTVVPENNAEIVSKLRQWEAPTAGVVYELQGPDAQAVTMPPAPPLMDGSNVNPELALEMAEVYELAILRDQPFNNFEGSKDAANDEIKSVLERLNGLSYVTNQTGRPRKVNSETKEFDPQTLFRGSSPGVEVGPYLSQFLLIGNTDVNQNPQGVGGGSVADGKITYGVIQIDQKVPIAEPRKDYMVNMHDYVQVQRGVRPDRETYGAKKGDAVLAPNRPPRRFISTPRDLATYVHYDALYEAYLNACIILLGMGTPFDPGFAQLYGGSTFIAGNSVVRNAGGFALYGGPHILNLVTEVATRALKAVRFQKFNNHIRLRPEALAAKIELLNCGATVPSALASDIGALKKAIQPTLDAVANGTGYKTNFLPMAFPEGSPMHPAYGAGHATVAGACVTILKAFFDTSAVLAKTKEKDGSDGFKFKIQADGDTPVVFRAPDLPHPTTGEGVPTQETLKCDPADQFLTLEGELNKLAANISIGRDMAGVHYFSDYYDSLRMGEEIAIGILEEQALTYSTDPFVLSVPTFDGDVVRIGNR
ncbi:MAG: vanadium-dependent haloperoxidase [Cyanobacteria bacterium P01_D01_bin.56]